MANETERPTKEAERRHRDRRKEDRDRAEPARRDEHPEDDAARSWRGHTEEEDDDELDLPPRGRSPAHEGGLPSFE